MSMDVPAWSVTVVACPSCGAEIGQPCRYRGRRDAGRVHIPRQTRAVNLEQRRRRAVIDDAWTSWAG